MCNISCLAPQTTAVYECDACGAQFSENEYSGLLRTDEDGFTDARCPFCGGMSFSDQYNRAFDGLPEDVKTILCDVMGEMKIDMEVFR